VNVDILVIGILVSLAVSELLGLSPGGIIVPAYIALFFRAPLRIAATFAAALAVYGVYRVISTRFILFGKRRFVAMILLGTLAAYAIQRLLPLAPAATPDMRAIGWVIPGLLANSFEKQKLVPTAILALASGGVVYALAFLLRVF
jgi:poly-gamma-glutamate biosynthesis protein PgsC/CapC